MIRDKTEMYRMMERGAFGNTNPMWWDLRTWSLEFPNRYPTVTHWGIRTSKGGGGPSLSMLDVPTFEVPHVFCRPDFRAAVPQISPMIWTQGNVTLLGEFWDSPAGLVFSGHEYPKDSQWRALMAHPKLYQGVSARLLARRHLNENSLEDLYDVLDKFPGCVYELSALDRCFGTVPHRNAVCWEVRHY